MSNSNRSHHKKDQNNKRQQSWQIQEAEARFLELIEATLKYGVQKITEDGEQIVVVMSLAEFERLTQPQESLIDFFQRSPYQDIDLNLKRNKDVTREVHL